MGPRAGLNGRKYIYIYIYILLITENTTGTPLLKIVVTQCAIKLCFHKYNTQKCTITPRGSAPNHSTPLHQHPSLDMTLRYFRPNPFLPFTLSPKNPFYFCPPKFCFIVTQLVYPKGFLCKTFHAFPPSSHSPAQPILGPPPPYFIILTRLGDINLIMMCGKQMTLLNNQ